MAVNNFCVDFWNEVLFRNNIQILVVHSRKSQAQTLTIKKVRRTAFFHYVYLFISLVPNTNCGFEGLCSKTQMIMINYLKSFNNNLVRIYFTKYLTLNNWKCVYCFCYLFNKFWMCIWTAESSNNSKSEANESLTLWCNVALWRWSPQYNLW